MISNNNNSSLNDMNCNKELNKNLNKSNISNSKDENIDYIDFLKKEFESEKKNNSSESNNNELIKRCQELIEDNRLLNTALNERTEKMNKIIQENLSLKSKKDEYALIIQKT